MGGKSGGPLSSWIREFTTLVFVQTVQAFIFAIIMIFILSTMDPSKVSSTGDDYNSAVGIMCVFALTSLFKVEEMVRRIFGLGNTKADHKGALKSIAKTAFALKIGKRVLDNGKNVIGGVKKLKNSKSDSKKANTRLQEDRSDLGLASSRRQGSANAQTQQGNQSSQQSATPLLSDVAQTVSNVPQTNRLANQDLMKKAIEAKKNGDMDGYAKYRKMQADVNKEVKDITDKPKRLGEESAYMQKAIDAKKSGDMDGYYKNRALQAGVNNARKQIESNNTSAVPSNTGIGSNQTNSGTLETVRMSSPPVQLNMTDDEIFNSSEIDARTKQRLRAAQRTAEEQIKAAKRMRNEGLKDIAKGLTETGGAIVVGTAGGILGGADGNIEEAIQGILTGAGLGDAMGTGAVNATVGIGKFAQNRVENVRNLSKEISAIKTAMDEDDASFGEAIKTRVKARTGALRDLQKNTEDLKTYLDNVKVRTNNNNSNRAYRSSVDDT